MKLFPCNIALLVLLLAVGSSVPVKAQKSRQPAIDTALLLTAFSPQEELGYTYTLTSTHKGKKISDGAGSLFLSQKDLFFYSETAEALFVLGPAGSITASHASKELYIKNFSDTTEALKFFTETLQNGTFTKELLHTFLTRTTGIKRTSLPDKNVAYLLSFPPAFPVQSLQATIDPQYQKLRSLTTLRLVPLLPNAPLDTATAVRQTILVKDFQPQPTATILPYYQARNTLAAFCKSQFAGYKIVNP